MRSFFGAPQCLQIFVNSDSDPLNYCRSHGKKIFKSHKVDLWGQFRALWLLILFLYVSYIRRKGLKRHNTRGLNPYINSRSRIIPKLKLIAIQTEISPLSFFANTPINNMFTCQVDHDGRDYQFLYPPVYSGIQVHLSVAQQIYSLQPRYQQPRIYNIYSLQPKIYNIYSQQPRYKQPRIYNIYSQQSRY